MVLAEFQDETSLTFINLFVRVGTADATWDRAQSTTEPTQTMNHFSIPSQIRRIFRHCMRIRWLKISRFGRFNADDVCSSMSNSTAIDIGSLWPHGSLSVSVVRCAHCEFEGVVVIVTERRVDVFGKVRMVAGCCWIRHCVGVQSILRCVKRQLIYPPRKM
jgi:hypothetical protein